MWPIQGFSAQRLAPIEEVPAAQGREALQSGLAECQIGL
jgi:hypothetical protein